MQIRPLRPADLEPLHALYLSQTALMPGALTVGLEQFASELTTTRYQENEHWDGECVALVAERWGQPVAFGSVSFLLQNARYKSLQAGTGIIRFLFSAAPETESLRAVIRALQGIAASRSCNDLRAFDAYTPLFYNHGASGLSNAWAWVARSLTQQGFETIGHPALAMQCDLNKVERSPLPLPTSAVLRGDYVTRIGERDATEGGLNLYFDGNRAAETMWHFGEKYVAGAGNEYVHLFWLGTNEPYRGQGLGRILLREALVRAQKLGARRSGLTCNLSNFYAHSLYRAEGYEPCDLLWSFQKRAK